MKKNERCGGCVYWFQKNGNRQCAFTQENTTENDFCSKYASTAARCCKCGSYIPHDAIILETEKGFEYICDNCMGQLGTCNVCKNNNYCAFQQDNSVPDPKQVQQTMRQGNMMFQTNVKNPVRVEKTCKVKCKCFDENNGCLRENGGTCANYS